MQGSPLVSIRCLVYNHEPFLRQCLDGFVMQQTTFPFEAIVHDDASTDGSAAIIREYAEKYPNIIKPIYETENQYSKHDGSILRIMEAAVHPDTKYIAICEGDDYWTDPHKLQIQVDFLESHLDYFVSSHDYSVYHEKTGVLEEKGHDRFNGISYEEFNGNQYHTFTNADYFNVWFISNLSAVIRRESYIDEAIKSQYPFFLDYINLYYVTKQGKCAFFKNNMAVYRMHEGGVCTGSNTISWNEPYLLSNYVLYKIEKDKRVLSPLNQSFVRLFRELLKQKNYERAFYILRRHEKAVGLQTTVSALIKLCSNEIKSFLKKTVVQYVLNRKEMG